MEPKKCIAMLLAGGRGSRLSILTNDLAKPALPFGGKYRIIDFALSNCTNSGMEVVGVLTQYKPLVLNSYISGGQPWDLDRIHGGVYVLPPYVTEEEEGHWYKGTADAIYQNIDFIESHDPDDVLVLSGDHIYRMDYSKMLKFHRKNEADATIAVIEVPWEEAPRFGIMTSDETGAIQKFIEKPKHPDSNQASMGVYIFKWAALKKYLLADEANPASQNDFGKNIIPAMLDNGRRMFSYAFDGYWKDVGTIRSYWEANMDLIGDPPTLQMDPQWRIYTRTPVQPPHYTADIANVTASYVTEGCNLYGTVVHSVLSAKVQIQEGAKVVDSILMPGVRVGAGSKLCRAIVGTGTVIGPGCIIGGAEHDSGAITTVGDHCTLLPGTVVPAGATVDQAALEKLYKQQEREKGGAAL